MAKGKENQYNIQDITVQACSTMDCTGLIPARPANDEELENYEELYPYLAKASQKSSKNTSSTLP